MANRPQQLVWQQRIHSIHTPYTIYRTGTHSNLKFVPWLDATTMIFEILRSNTLTLIGGQKIAQQQLQ